MLRQLAIVPISKFASKAQGLSYEALNASQIKNMDRLQIDYLLEQFI